MPFNISCGHCFMCDRKLYGQVPGGQAEYLRVPQADFGPIKMPEGPPEERFLYLSDVLPTSWQAVEYASIPEVASVAIFGLGPIGQMCALT
jgi:threonine dehydrogenase-like Zn-dependent dehydrogenase